MRRIKSRRDNKVGPEAFIDLFAGRVEQAERELVNNLSTGIYSDGTGSSSKQITGLQALVSDAGTGTVGGINSTTYTWWKNQIYSFATAVATPSSATIQTAMNTLFLKCSRKRNGEEGAGKR